MEMDRKYYSVERLALLELLPDLRLALQQAASEEGQRIFETLRRDRVGLDRLLKLCAVVREIIDVGAGELLVDSGCEKRIDLADVGETGWGLVAGVDVCGLGLACEAGQKTASEVVR